jgi:hypothetical protein
MTRVASCHLIVIQFLALSLQKGRGYSHFNTPPVSALVAMAAYLARQPVL